MPADHITIRGGWKVYGHPAFVSELTRVANEVTALEHRRPESVESHPRTKYLRRLFELIMSEIPYDPAAAAYQLSNTLGPTHRHWRRAKFLGRFRLFFRFSSAQKTVLYGWVNDENTLRKAGGKSGPYAVFIARLRGGRPPDDWDELLQEAKAASPMFRRAIGED